MIPGEYFLAGAPIAQGDDVFVVLPATLPEAELERRFLDADAAVVMKLGRHLAKVRRVLERTGRLELGEQCGVGLALCDPGAGGGGELDGEVELFDVDETGGCQEASLRASRGDRPRA